MAEKVEYIEAVDKLNTGRKKINDFAIAPALRAEKNSEDAKSVANSSVKKADEANQKSDSTQQQLDTLILESGTSDAEVIQARMDSRGQQAPLLKDRLNSIDQDLTDISVNVKWYGAVGDGVSDDTDAIQTVLNLTKQSNIHLRVLIPPGIYRVSAILSVFKNTEIIASGATILRSHEGHILMNGEAGDAFNGYEGNSNISIVGGTWDGNVTEYHSSGFAGLCFVHCQNIKLRDLTIKDIMSAHAVDLAGVKNCEIDNVTFQGFLMHTNPDLQRDYSEAIQIEMCLESSWDIFGNQDGTPCEDIRINNIHFVESDTEGTIIWRAGVGHHSAIDGIFSKNIKIFNTVFEGQGYGAIRAFKWKDVTIKDCQFLNCGKGVIINAAEAGTSNALTVDGTQSNHSEAGANHVIENCVFDGCTDTPIYAVGFVTNNEALVEGVKVVNCEFKNSLNTIYMKYAKFISFLNCRFADFSGDMLTLSLCGNVFFDNCIAERINGSAVRCSGATANNYLIGVFIKKSYFENVKTNAVNASAVENVFISDCTIVNSASGPDVDAITVWSSSKRGKIADNVIVNSGTKGKTGVILSTACSDISVINNTISGYTNETYVPGGVDSLYARPLTQKRDGNTVYPDTNWQAPTVQPGVSLVSGVTNRCRRIDNICEINTRIKGVSSTFTDLVKVPSSIAPSASLVRTIVSNSNKTARVTVGTDGMITLANVTTGNSFDAADEWYVSLNWLFD